MWPRIVEIVLAVWLAAGSLLLDAGDLPDLRLSELIPAAAALVIALLSFHPRLQRLYLAQIVVGLWLIGYAFWVSGGPAPPAVQSAILVGALLAMFGLIPNEANEPPRSWRRLNESPSSA